MKAKQKKTSKKATKAPKYSFPDHATMGELYGPAMEIKTKEKASEYLMALVAWCLKASAAEHTDMTAEKALALQRQNLGYYAGYYDSKTYHRVQDLFNCEHPVFGKKYG